jgi:uncharacterized protein YheU (UPF0270 family)
VIIPLNKLTDFQIDNLITTYCTQYMGLNDIENPVADNRERVLKALKRGEMVVVYSERRQTAWLAMKSEIEQARKKAQAAKAERAWG